MIVYIYGPPGSGKSQNANYLKGKFGCKRIVDEYTGIEPIKNGDLVLGQSRDLAPKDSKIFHIADALR